MQMAVGAMSGLSDPGEPHTSSSVDHSIAGLRLVALEMGALVIDQVADAVRSLTERDAALAHLVLAREARVDEYEKRLDRDSLTFIALQQPVANDLRLSRAIVRIGRELERAGDEAKKIARFALTLDKSGTGDPILVVGRHLRHMASLSGSMLRNAVRAADEMDVVLARGVLQRDAELDAEFAAGLRLVMSYVMQDHRFLRPTIDTIFALKGLERIGDHATNVAEQVLYMAGADSGAGSPAAN
jgi:phosphate transport system protein